jgi:hypothetical protein
MPSDGHFSILIGFPTALYSINSFESAEDLGSILRTDLSKEDWNTRYSYSYRCFTETNSDERYGLRSYWQTSWAHSSKRHGRLSKEPHNRHCTRFQASRQLGARGLPDRQMRNAEPSMWASSNSAGVRTSSKRVSRRFCCTSAGEIVEIEFSGFRAAFIDLSVLGGRAPSAPCPCQIADVESVLRQQAAREIGTLAGLTGDDDFAVAWQLAETHS